MVNLNKMISDFRSALGWPYVSPGSNDRNGIDCSGMFVRAYRLQGASIYHGSNTIWRQYTGEKGTVRNSAQLKRGMAVFKHREQDTSKFHDGQGDFYHIGLVVAENPVKIIHASTNGMQVREDTWGKAWSHWAYLKDVDYDGNGNSGEVETLQYAWVKTPNGGSVNLRVQKSTASSLKARIPNNTKLEVLDCSDVEWYHVVYDGISGWVRAEFLSESDPTVTAPQTVSLARFEALEKRVSALEAVVAKLPKPKGDES